MRAILAAPPQAQRRSGGRNLAVTGLLLLIFAGCVSASAAAAASSQDDGIAAIQKLFEEQRWHQVIEEIKASAAREPELNYYHGAALARLDLWEEARGPLLAGQRLRPNDERFLVELGGVAFRQKRYSEAARWLRRAIRLKPDDRYAADFLGTVYFLQGNLEAALKYWNRIAKPQIENVKVEPGLRVDSVLLDRAFAFAPVSTLLLSELLSSRARVDGLGIFPIYKFDVGAREDGKFDVTFAARERNGWGNSKWEAVLSTLRGAAYQTVHPEYSNLARSAINITSVVRWDAQKRRLLASLSSPLGQDPGRRYSVGFDARDERWDLRRPFNRPALTLGALRLRRNAVGGEISSFGGRWSWSSGGELSHRNYRDVSEGFALPVDTLATGYQLKQTGQVTCELWRLPDRRVESILRVSSEAGRIWSAPGRFFERLQIAASAHWLPQTTGDDYAMRQQIRAGKIFGQAPFDELFILGLERDNDLWMRAHVGTRGGRKGSAPMGRSYFLANWEIDKNLYQDGLLGVKVSPFLDVGKNTDRSSGLGSQKWLADTGVQAKFRVLGVGFLFVCGKDLRSGKNAFYVLAGR